MTDTLTHEHRSWLMSRVRSKDTKPEWILRSALHRLGFRYRLCRPGLAGKPDLVLRKYRSAIFVHGCFWHRHPGCPKATTPKSNRAFWEEKFRRNIERDRRNYRELRNEGWRVIVVWQCELYGDTINTIDRVVTALLENEGKKKGDSYADVLERGRLLQVAEERVRYRLRRECNGR